jgi:pimeloyl-ACP methyl ester carboxylesterase
MSFRTIFLHGALGSAKQMQALASLIEADTECMDLPGHGARSNDDAPFDIERMAMAVAKCITQPEDLFGYSMGGYVALYLAATQPDKVKRVVTLATKFHWTPEGADQEVRMLNAEKVKEKVPAFAALLETRHGSQWPLVMERTAQMMLALGQQPILTPELLGSITCPVLLLRGTEDTMVSREETLWAQRHLTNAQFQQLEGQPHPLEKVDLSVIVNLFRETF